MDRIHGVGGIKEKATTPRPSVYPIGIHGGMIKSQIKELKALKDAYQLAEAIAEAADTEFYCLCCNITIEDVIKAERKRDRALLDLLLYIEGMEG
jgi:hypothetical protein